LSENANATIRHALAQAKLEKLVNIRNPLDITPMAGEDVYTRCATAMLEDGAIDAVVVSVVPFTSELTTTRDELNTGRRSLADDLPALFKKWNKPLIAVIDAGKMYDPLAVLLRQRGVPVFPSCDQAIRSLGRYVCHRVDHARESAAPPKTDPAELLEALPSHDFNLRAIAQ